MSDRESLGSEASTRLSELASLAGQAASPPAPGAIRHRARRQLVRRQAAAVMLTAAVLGAGVTAVYKLGVPGSGGPNPGTLPGSQVDGSASSTRPAASGSAVPSASVTTRATEISVPCRKAVLSVAAGPLRAASGHRGSVLLFTNQGSQPCTLVGYPTVTAVDSSGGLVRQAQQTISGYLGGVFAGAIPTVTLGPGQSASAFVELVGAATVGGACTPYVGLQVTAPGDTEAIQLEWAGDGCEDLQVHPLVPGTEGRLG